MQNKKEDGTDQLIITCLHINKLAVNVQRSCFIGLTYAHEYLMMIIHNENVIKPI